MRSLRRTLLGTVLAAGMLVTMTGCVGVWPFNSPKTTYVNDAGDEVTVDWRDFPGTVGIEIEQVFDAPSVEQTAAREREALAAVQEALEQFVEEPGSWESVGEGGWFTNGDNGYYGTSMLQTYNSPSWQFEVTIPVSSWDSVLDAAEEALAELGMTHRYDDEFDSTVSDWLRSATFSAGPEFLSISVEDAALDPQALGEAQGEDRMIAGITLFYGTSTIAEGERAEFEQRVAPYLGLEMPEATS